MGLEDNYVPFKKLPVVGFHINSVFAIIGLLISLFMFGHTLYVYKIKKNENPKLKKKNAPTNHIVYSSLIVFFSSIFLFVVYSIEFFFLRMFPPNKYNYDAFKFCKRSVCCPFIYTIKLIGFDQIYNHNIDSVLFYSYLRFCWHLV